MMPDKIISKITRSIFCRHSGAGRNPFMSLLRYGGKWTPSSDGVTEDSRHANKRTGESGSALVYILIAIALLALLTVVFMEPSSQQTQSQSMFKTVSELRSQIEFVRSAAQECVIVFPRGDTTVDTSGPGTDPGANDRYPLNPDSAHLATAAGNRNVSGIRCPGRMAQDDFLDNLGVMQNTGNNNQHPLVFGGSSGKFMPPAPGLFNDWKWYNGTDGIFFWIDTDNTDAFITTALQKVDDEFSECEADVIDASGGLVELTSTATGADPKCAAGSTCFRVWIIAQASNVYLGDTDGEEAAVPCP